MKLGPGLPKIIQMPIVNSFSLVRSTNELIIISHFQMPHESTVDHYDPHPMFEEDHKCMTMMSPALSRKRTLSNQISGTHNSPHQKSLLAIAPDPVELTHGHDEDE